MDLIPLIAQERTILGKKVNKLRRSGLIPAHIFGKKISTDHISVNLADFLKVYRQTGESGLIDLKVSDKKSKPVLVRGVSVNPRDDKPVHIDFYQVNLLEKVQVNVPVVLEGEEPEVVHSGEAVVIQPLNEVSVEALPAELPEEIKVSISSLQQINDAITVSQLTIPAGVTVLTEPEAVVVKLDTAITEEMKKLMEEQAAEAAAAQTVIAEAGEVLAEGEVPTEGEQLVDESVPEKPAEEKPAEEKVTK